MTVVSEDWIELAHDLADLARPIAAKFFRTPLDIVSKADESPVTIADRTIEEVMRAEIERRFPDHGILGEEHGSVRLDAEAVWVLDPIDGTKAFISGMPLFGTLIACCVDRMPVLGIIDQPIQRERWAGVAGRRSTYNGAPIRASGKTDLGDAILYTTGPEMFEDTREEAGFESLKAKTALTRYSGDCYAHALLASGHVDLVVESGLKPYDYCALVPVIEGAGGMITDWDGKGLTIDSDGRTLSSASAGLHAKALATLRNG